MPLAGVAPPPIRDDPVGSIVLGDSDELVEILDLVVAEEGKLADPVPLEHEGQKLRIPLGARLGHQSVTGLGEL